MEAGRCFKSSPASCSVAAFALVSFLAADAEADVSTAARRRKRAHAGQHPRGGLSLTRWHFLAICQISKSNLNTDLPVGVTGAPRKPRAQLFATSQAPDGGGVESPHCRRLTEQKRMTTIETDAAGPASYRPC